MFLSVGLVWFSSSLYRLFLVALLAWLYKEVTMGMTSHRWPAKPLRLRNKVVFVTRVQFKDLGYQTVVQLANHGARVYFGCSSPLDAKFLCQQLSKEVPSGAFEGLPMDLSCLNSIQECVSSLKNKVIKLDALINFGGASGAEKNYLISRYYGIVYFTFLTLDLLKRSSIRSTSKALVLNVCSTWHLATVFCSRKQLDLDMQMDAKPDMQYCFANLALACFSKSLAECLDQSNNIWVASVVPGFISNDVCFPAAKQFNDKLVKLLGYLLGRNTFQGCQTILHLVLSVSSGTMDKKQLHGQLFSDCRKSSFLVSPKLGQSVFRTYLWQETQNWLKITFPTADKIGC